MSLNALLAELESLNYAGRIRRMIALGRDSVNDADAAEVLRQMEQGDVYQRRMALFGCYGSRNGEFIVRALSDESRQMRGAAMQVLVEVATDDQMRAGFDRIAPKYRHHLITLLLKRGRRAPVEAIIAALIERGEAQTDSL